MVSEDEDKSIAQTCLREMEEEIGIGHNQASVLGVLRCNWGEVCIASLVVLLPSKTSFQLILASLYLGAPFSRSCSNSSCMLLGRNGRDSTKSQPE